MVETTHITIGQWSQIDKDNAKLRTRNPNKGKIIIQSQSFIDFQAIREKHEQSLNIEHHRMNSISILEEIFVKYLKH